jgi:hypothetical protein
MLIPAADATGPFGSERRVETLGGGDPDLARTGMRVPEFYAGDLLCPIGKAPL